MFRSGMLVKNWPTLLRIGEMASERSQAEYWQTPQAKTPGPAVVDPSQQHFSKLLVRQEPGRSRSVLPGFPAESRVRFAGCAPTAAPEIGPDFFKTEIMPRRPNTVSAKRFLAD